MQIRRFAIRTFTFVVMAGILAVALHTLNWVPELFRPGLAKAYPDIETAGSALGIRNIPVPTYFPENITWPPSTVVAQSYPYPAILLQFTAHETSDDIMVITRTPEGKRPLLKTAVDDIVEQSRADLNGNSAALVTGTCRQERPCSLITWSDAGQQTSVLLYERPFELIKIAQSIHP
jgi:hypothetical protein